MASKSDSNCKHPIIDAVNSKLAVPKKVKTPKASKEEPAAPSYCDEHGHAYAVMGDGATRLLCPRCGTVKTIPSE